MKIKEAIFMKKYIELSLERILFLKKVLLKQLKGCKLNEKNLEKIGGGSVLTKKFVAGLLTLIMLFSSLPNQSVEAVRSANDCSSVIKSGNDNSTGKKFSLETLKKLKVPMAIAGAVGGGSALIGALTCLTIHQLKNTKVSESEKFIAKVDSCRKGVLDAIWFLGAYIELNAVDSSFKNLKNEAIESAKKNEFDKATFDRKLSKIFENIRFVVNVAGQRINWQIKKVEESNNKQES